jgi:dolichol-phosphate mannosyltransferase
MSLQQNLISMEHARERYWLKHSRTSELKLRWRAITVRHCFHVLPGESILEIGAGSGLWTKHLADVVRGESPITAAVFSPEFVGTGSDGKLPNTNFVCVTDLFSDFPPDSFDYIVGTSILCHDEYSMHLRALYRLLKPGGQILFFEANFWNPQVFIKTSIPAVGRWAGNAMCQVGLRKYLLLRLASHQNFTQVDIIPYDILHPSTPRCLIGFLQSITFLFEHTPIIREFCGTLYIWARSRASKKTAGHEPIWQFCHDRKTSREDDHTFSLAFCFSNGECVTGKKIPHPMRRLPPIPRSCKTIEASSLNSLTAIAKPTIV